MLNRPIYFLGKDFLFRTPLSNTTFEDNCESMENQQAEVADWQREFQEAVLENDKTKRLNRIKNVEKIIHKRLHSLKDEEAERETLVEALTALRIMKEY